MKKYFQNIIVAVLFIATAENTNAQAALGLSFDGVDDRVTIPQNTNYNRGTGNFTIEAWIKADVSQQFSEPTIFSNREAANPNTGIQIFLSAGKLTFRAGGTTTSSVGNDLRDGQCHHIAVRRHSSGSYGFYIDGVWYGGSSGLNQNVNTTHDVWIGVDEPTSATSRFKGVIHEVRFWTQVLASEVTYRRYTYLYGNESQLIGYWRMNDGSGQTIDDLTSVNNNGNRGATSATETSDPTYVAGCMCTTTATITSSVGTVICGAAGITLNATAGAGLTFQWMQNGIDIAGATNSSYAALTAGTFTCRILNGTCGNTSNAIALTSTNPIIGVTYTGSLYICMGGSTIFTSNVTNGGTTPTYQWKLNGNNIAGATAPTYTANQQGTYNVLVTNTSGCSALSYNTQYLTVFTTTPVSTISYINGSSYCNTVGMQITGGSVAGHTYQWQQVGNPTYGVTNNYYYYAGGSGTYRCAVTNACGTSFSNSLFPTVSGTGYITYSGNQNLCSGSITLNAPYVGAASYQWFNNNFEIHGATSATYVATGAGVYTCSIITAQCGNYLSNNSVVIDGKPSIVAQGPLEFCNGNNVTLKAFGDSTATAYQWTLNGSNISGATTNTFVATATGNYACNVTSPVCGIQASNTLAATAGATPQVIAMYGGIASGSPLDVCNSFSEMIFAYPLNAGTYTMYEYTNNFQVFSQATGNFYSPGSGYYYIELDNGCGTTQSTIFGVRDINSPHSIISDGAVYFCSSATPPYLRVTNNNFSWISPLPYIPPWNYYQWKVNGVNIPNSNIPSIQPTQTGWYSCVIANSCDTANYVDSLYITVSQAPSTSVSATGPLTFCQGQSVTFNVTPTVGAVYQWYRNNTTIVGATSTGYTALLAGTYKVGVTNGACSNVYSADQVVTLTLPFTPVITCANPTILCSGQTATLQAATGAGYTYVWALGGIAISGATASSYVATATGTYTVKITDAQACYNTSAGFVITSGLHSANITSTNGNPVCATTSGSVVMNSNATGSDITAFQWKFNGVAISGATNTVYSQIAAQLSSGNYTVEVTNGCGTFVSAPYTLTVNPLPTTPVISTSGNNYFCNPGSIVLNSTTQAGVTYQWYNTSPISGATSSSYTASTAGSFSVRTTNANGCVGYSATFPVYSAGFSPAITPSNIVGACSTLVYTATPATGVTYQWYRNGSTLTGATSSTYTATSSGTYSCGITKSGCGTTTITATAMILLTQVYSITLNAPVTTLCSGQTAYMAAPSSSYYQYQWKLNGSNISGATQYYYYATAAGSYSCFVTQPCGTTTSNTVVVTVNPAATAAISAGGSTNLCNGASVTLNANTGTGLTYQWTSNGSSISGATSASYTTNVGGTYRCVVTNSGGCSATSNFINIFTGAGATAAITGPTSFCAGSSITLTANTGTGISYQWYKNSVAQSGATSSTYLIGAAGTYYVVETSSCGTATSNSLVVTQINNPNPTMSYTTPTTFCSPGTITFTANTFSGVTYQWQKNSIDIAGATNQTYTATTNGKYRVKQTANGCTKQGQDVQVTTATSVASVIAANGPTSFCTGGSVVLSVSNAIPGYSYQWKNNNVNISGATLSNYTATTAGSYTCYVSANCGNATSNAIAVSTGGIVALVNPSGTVNICNGATVAMSANTGTGYTFQWKKNGTNISGATTQNYNATTAGAYTVAITSLCGNATSVATTVAITALTATASPSSTTICNGSAATFTANTGYNFTYQWYRAGIAIAGATSSTHANSTAGNYTVVITQGGVCSATSNIAALTIISNPNPTVTLSGPTTFCAGQSVTITANTFAGVTYQWIKGSTNITGATNQSYTATTAGQYNVKETANGCTKQMGVPVVVTVNCKIGDEWQETSDGSELKVIPNPFTDGFEVSGLMFVVGDKIQLIDVLGKTVLTNILSTTTSNIKLQTSNLLPGVYFLQVTTPKEKKVVKVVKQ